MREGEELLKRKEREAIQKLEEYLAIFRKFESPIKRIAMRKYSPEQILEAEGKKCIIAVSGLRFHQKIYFFKVDKLSLTQVEPFDQFDTFIQVPISIINEFLERILSGDETAFGDLVGRDDVKFRGRRTFHDMMIFEDIFSTLARNIRKIREEMRR